MKSHALRNLQSVISNLNFAFLFLLALAVCFASVAAHAQSGTWYVDADHSVARLSLGSGSNEMDIGVARITGELVFESSDPADPVVTLKVNPGNDPLADSAQLSFTSRQSATTADGKLIVTGDLSVTRVTRSVTIEPNEAYRGPVYGEPVAHTDTREITLVFSAPRQPAVQNGAMELAASTTLSRETFPQLLDALTPGQWPTTLVNDENCRMPSTIGEDYSGPICTGTVIATANRNEVISGTAGGEDYRGFEPAVVPNHNQATIALDLKLTQLSPASPTAFKDAVSAGR